MPGYRVGPTLPGGEMPWPTDWESAKCIDDGHVHDWETVLLGTTDEFGNRVRHRIEEVVRCAICLAPRCGSSIDPDPCMCRRHHRTCHLLLSGRVEHLGGSPTSCRCS